MLVNYNVEIKSRLAFNQNYVKKILDQAAKILKLPVKNEVTIVIVGNKKIKALNKKFRQQNKVTDVLSFNQREGEKIIRLAELNSYLGEIFLCYPRLVSQAKKYGNSVKEETGLLLVHGLLHLLGYDDQTLAADKKMKKVQEKILTNLYV